MEGGGVGFWKKCSNCKKEITFNTAYFRCSVSTCNHSRTGLQFCSVSCWSSHVPIYRHRDAWAIEAESPAAEGSATKPLVSDTKSVIETKLDEGAPQLSKELKSPPQKFFVARPQQTSGAQAARSGAGNETLVVASKLKAYIREKSDMNTSADVLEVLSDFLRHQCDEAIRRARSDGRKTVMARDF